MYLLNFHLATYETVILIDSHLATYETVILINSHLAIYATVILSGAPATDFRSASVADRRARSRRACPELAEGICGLVPSLRDPGVSLYELLSAE